MESWSAGVMESWSAGAVESWSAGAVESWSAGVMSGDRGSATSTTQHSRTPTLHHSRTPSLHPPNTPSSSYQLPLLHVEILRHELGAQVFVLEQRKAHPATLQNFFQFTQLVPENVPAQLLVNLVERRDVRVRKKRAHA